MKPTSAIPLAIIVGGVIVAGAVYLSMAQSGPKIGDNTGNPALMRPVDSTDHILGNPAAPIKIVEYSDFQCEYCKDFENTLHQVVANEGAKGEVAWVYRQFPLIEIHPNALAHARATECAAVAGGNDIFWKFSSELFKRQQVDPSQYGVIASAVGLTGDAFSTCYADGAKMDARIMTDRQNALDMGAQGAPYSIILISGRAPIVMDGAYSYDAVKQLIDEALSN